ncbi:hypothetical protein CCACVL1_00381, partial [Corchorus capsularis]
ASSFPIMKINNGYHHQLLMKKHMELWLRKSQKMKKTKYKTITAKKETAGKNCNENKKEP